MIRALIRIFVSRTTRTHGVHFIINQFEDLLLVISGITILDLTNGKIKHAASHCFINEAGQVAFLAAIASKKDSDCPVCFFRDR